MNIHRVSGRDAGDILIYALSTCGWCKKTKEFLNTLGVSYAYIDVDLLDPAEQSGATGEMTRWNPSGSFPTLVINGRDCVIGFDESGIRKALGL